MNFKCPNCGASLVFDPHSQKVVCDFCCTEFDINEIQAKEETMTQLSEEEMEASGLQDDDSYMGLNVYTCTSCGGQIMVNGVEASTFCSFCGQPTIIFDRIQQSKKPKYILPFSYPKEKVEQSVRLKISNSFFAKKEIKTFETECLRGIYIPFWLMDVKCNASMVLRGTEKNGDHSSTYYYYRKGNANFENLTLDASEQLSDECSQRLEPFELSEMKPFKTDYLTGFYADVLDLDAGQLEELAKTRAKDLFYKEIAKTVKANDVCVEKDVNHFEVTKSDYALLPVWFLSFHVNEKPYTYLINGQTGKMIGAVDYNTSKAKIGFILLGLVLIVPAILVCYLLMNPEDDEFFKGLMIVIGAIVALLFIGIDNKTSVEENLGRTHSENMFKLVKKRQGEEK